MNVIDNIEDVDKNIHISAEVIQVFFWGIVLTIVTGIVFFIAGKAKSLVSSKAKPGSVWDYVKDVWPAVLVAFILYEGFYHRQWAEELWGSFWSWIRD